jgi:hypothetical protein
MTLSTRTTGPMSNRGDWPDAAGTEPRTSAAVTQSVRMFPSGL